MKKLRKIMEYRFRYFRRSFAAALALVLGVTLCAQALPRIHAESVDTEKQVAAEVVEEKTAEQPAEEIKEEVTETKEEAKEEIKEEVNEDVNEEIKEEITETKEEVTEETTEEITEIKEEVKEEVAEETTENAEETLEDLMSFAPMMMMLALPPEEEKFDITLLQPEAAGTISVDGGLTEAAKDTPITLVAAPNANYVFSEWIVTDGDGQPVAVSGNSFTMPASNVTVSAEFIAIKASGTVDKSDPKVAWYITTDNELVIYPADGVSGTMTVFIGSPWNSYKTSITSVKVLPGVKLSGSAKSLFSGFSACITFDVDNLDVSACTSMSNMFYNCKAAKSISAGSWNTGSVTSMYGMFYTCSSLTTLDVSKWNTGNVTDMKFMFRDCAALTPLDVSGWNTGSVEDMTYMFNDCSSLKTLDVSKWNTGNVTNMESIFDGCAALKTIDVSGWDTGRVGNMNYMFNNCTTVTKLDVSGWDTGNVESMKYMFSSCSDLTTIPVGSWNTGKVTIMNNMFSSCSNLTTVPVGNWNTGEVTDMGSMFSGCSALKELDITNWDVSKVTEGSSFVNTDATLVLFEISPSWFTSNVRGTGCNFVWLESGRFKHATANGYSLHSITIHESGKPDVVYTTPNIPDDLALASNQTATVRFSRLRTVTTNKTGKGTLSCATSAWEDDIVTITATPGEERELVSLTVKDTASGESEYTVTNKTFVMPSVDVTVYATFAPHDWVYAADNNVLTAYCNNDCGCDYDGEDHAVSLTLSAPEDLVCDGPASFPATLDATEKAAWEAAGLTVPTIMYKKGAAAATAEAPTGIGKYVASITCGAGEKAKTAQVTYAVVELKVIEGAGGIHRKDSGKDLQFRSNGKYSRFIGIEVDGQPVDKSNYTSWEGSTYVELDDEYLDKLTVGTHTLTFLYEGGKSCECTFRVWSTASGGSAGVATGDDSNIILFVGITIVAALVLAGSIFAMSRKKKHQEND